MYVYTFGKLSFPASGKIGNFKANHFMKSLGIALATLTIIAALSTGCKKSKSKSNTDLITQSSWKFQSATVGGVDVGYLLDSCEKDNILTFKSDGSGVEDEGATKCSTTAPQSNNFTWSFTNNESVLHVSDLSLFGVNSDCTLKGINETQLILAQTVILPGSVISQEVTVIFIH